MYFSLAEVAACVNYNNSTPEPSEFSTHACSNTGILLCCTGAVYCLKMEGLLLGRVRTRTPWALNLARAMGIVGFFFRVLTVALGYESTPLGDPAGHPPEDNNGG
jgi:hypothetical protein